MRCLLYVSLTLVLTACSAVTPAPVDSRPQPPSKKITTHEVGKGETLFSIAWAYGLDYRGLARANGIDASYTIHPGQVLQLTDQTPTVARSSTVTRPVSTASVRRTYQSTSSAGRPASGRASVAASSASLTWQWPATGSLIGRFATGRATSNKGIDIAGEAGDPVRAAAAGSVVYSGSGLLGYGQLVIIKHNDQFLSAYAHNRRLLVKEGDQIKAGEKIAEMGSSGAEKVKLHFEIRRSGKPVNPETYLPKR